MSRWAVGERGGADHRGQGPAPGKEKELGLLQKHNNGKLHKGCEEPVTLSALESKKAIPDAEREWTVEGRGHRAELLGD